MNVIDAHIRGTGERFGRRFDLHAAAMVRVCRTASGSFVGRHRPQARNPAASASAGVA